jgi:hypothetical protein
MEVSSSSEREVRKNRSAGKAGMREVVSEAAIAKLQS